MISNWRWKHLFMKTAFPTALFSGSALILAVVNFLVPTPYMDEIFHVDQMQRYCQNRFNEWNDKITTPPALYLVTYALWKPVSAVLDALPLLPPGTFECHVSHLRFVNQLFLMILYVVFVDLQGLLIASTRKQKASITLLSVYACATNLCLFPVLYFTSFLYYTDVLSTVFVLLTYSFQLRRRYAISGLFGILACLVRQTNIVWVAFTAFNGLIDELASALYATTKKFDVSSSDSEEDYDFLYSDYFDLYTMPPTMFIKKLYDQLGIFCVGIIILKKFWCYLLVGMGFVAFSVYNGGFALGDRTAHQACAHLVQFGYCAVFTSAFGVFAIAPLPTAKSVLKTLSRHLLKIIFTVCILVVIIHYCTFDHPYLLADNRHYTFYIWRRWFCRHPSLKYLLAPVYLVSFAMLLRSLAQTCHKYWVSAFVVTVIAVTVPNRLLEFRYFIIPYYFWRLHVPFLSKKRLALEFLMFFIINVTTLILFLFKPFKWETSDDWQRFMW